MAKDTFLNLPEDKRHRIIDAALAEFAQHTYEMASLSRIVGNLEIAKGSMYQYFTNKQALYMYVVNHAYDYKRNYLKDVFQASDDFFVTVSHYYQKSFLFSLEYPAHHRVISNFWESKDELLHQKILESKAVRAMDFDSMLIEAMEKGEVNPELCREAAFFVFHSVGKELIDNFQNLRHGQVQEHLSFINDVFILLASGLKPRTKGEF